MAAEGGKITIVENKLSKTRLIRLLSCLLEDTLACLQILTIINIEDFLFLECSPKVYNNVAFKSSSFPEARQNYHVITQHE